MRPHATSPSAWSPRGLKRPSGLRCPPPTGLSVERGRAQPKPTRTAIDRVISLKLTAAPFHFAVSVVPGPDTFITVTGDLDLASTPAFEAAVADVELESVHHAVLDLERLDFMDAVGLHAVLALNEKCDSASATLTIRPGPRRVQRVFELTGTDHELTFTGRQV
jgi:anti-sigma B factor antagonist